MIPDAVTLEEGHVTPSNIVAGSDFVVGSQVTLQCDSEWVYSDGSMEKQFNCTAGDTVTPEWEYCTGTTIKATNQGKLLCLVLQVAALKLISLPGHYSSWYLYII